MFFIISMIALIVFLHIDNVKFFRKLDRIDYVLKNNKHLPKWEDI